jgi:hypothetical protein
MIQARWVQALSINRIGLIFWTSTQAIWALSFNAAMQFSYKY